jgi:F-type H+-transporting ATPase subunit b
MLIDWFTVGAQALNFLILVWLLQRYLYRPILSAIDAREKGIAAKLSDASGKQAAAQKEHADFDNKNKAFDVERAALLSKATDEAKAEHDRLIDEARKEADSLSAMRATALKTEQSAMCRAITRAAREEVFAIARKALVDLADANLEERVSAVFTRRLGEMDVKTKDTLRAALGSSEPALVRSVFDMPAGQKATIQNALNETFAAEVHLRFETAPDAVSGIELSAGGQKFGWSIADYLTSLDRKVGEALDARPASK